MIALPSSDTNKGPSMEPLTRMQVSKAETGHNPLSALLCNVIDSGVPFECL